MKKILTTLFIATLFLSSAITTYAKDFGEFTLSLDENWKEIPYNPTLEELNLEEKYSGNDNPIKYLKGYRKKVQRYEPVGRLSPNSISSRLGTSYVLLRDIEGSMGSLESIKNEIESNSRNIFSVNSQGLIYSQDVKIHPDIEAVIIKADNYRNDTISAIFPGKGMVIQIDFYSNDLSKDSYDFYKVIESFSYDEKYVYPYIYSESIEEESIFKSAMPMVQNILWIALALLLLQGLYRYTKDDEKIVTDKREDKKIELEIKEKQISSISEKVNPNIVPIWKFTVLSVITLGIYMLIWFYRQWKFLKKKESLDVMPFARALFSPFYIFSIASKTKDFLKRNNIKVGYSPIFVSIVYWLIWILSGVEGTYIWVWTIMILSVIPLVHGMNKYWQKDKNNEHKEETKSK